MNDVMELLQRVKAYIPPLEFYRLELRTMSPSKAHGWCDGGLCPFHNDRRPGSFEVNLTTGAFRCFSCDARGGDLIDFIKLRDGLSFLEALQKLADDWGV